MGGTAAPTQNKSHRPPPPKQRGPHRMGSNAMSSASTTSPSGPRPIRRKSGPQRQRQRPSQSQTVPQTPSKMQSGMASNQNPNIYGTAEPTPSKMPSRAPRG